MNLFKKTAVFCIVLFSWNVYGQTSEIDSLKGVLRNSPHDTITVNTLIDIGMAYLSVDINEALRFGNLGRELAKQTNYTKGLAFAHKLLGIGYAYKGKVMKPTFSLRRPLPSLRVSTTKTAYRTF